MEHPSGTRHDNNTEWLAPKMHTRERGGAGSVDEVFGNKNLTPRWLLVSALALRSPEPQRDPRVRVARCSACPRGETTSQSISQTAVQLGARPSRVRESPAVR